MESRLVTWCEHHLMIGWNFFFFIELLFSFISIMSDCIKWLYNNCLLLLHTVMHPGYPCNWEVMFQLHFPGKIKTTVKNLKRVMVSDLLMLAGSKYSTSAHLKWKPAVLLHISLNRIGVCWHYHETNYDWTAWVSNVADYLLAHPNVFN